MIKEMSIGIEVALNVPFEQAIEVLTSELKKEGFGILTRINAHKILAEKLGIDFRPYVILGACNPHLAYQALSADPLAGLVLPCNITVESTPEDYALIRIANPLTIMDVGGLSNSPVFKTISQQAYDSISRVVQALTSFSDR